jgi:predicted GH43/DUF377 family glycosyl hydrolase
MELNRKLLLSPTARSFENLGVCNPACIRIGDTTHMFYRAIGTERRSTIGYCQFDEQHELISRKHEPILIPELDTERDGL